MINFQELEKVAEFKNGELNWLEGRDINAVYVILVGDEYYIGSSHYTYLRIGQHLKALLCGEHHSCKLQEKFNATKEFDVFVLERGIEKSKLQIIEFNYIRKHQPTLNIIQAEEDKRGMRIKELIKEKGYTQKEFADKLGMTNIGLSQIVNGKPSYTTLEKIASALDVPMWQLFASKKEIMGESGGHFIQCPKCSHEFEIDIKIEAK